jgi:hypothetical protein
MGELLDRPGGRVIVDHGDAQGAAVWISRGEVTDRGLARTCVTDLAERAETLLKDSTDN